MYIYHICFLYKLRNNLSTCIYLAHIIPVFYDSFDLRQNQYSRANISFKLKLNSAHT